MAVAGAVGGYDDFAAAKRVRPGFNSILEFGNPAIVFPRVRLTSFRQPRRFVNVRRVFILQSALVAPSRGAAGHAAATNVLSFPKGSAQGYGARSLRNPLTDQTKAQGATGVALHLLTKYQ